MKNFKAALLIGIFSGAIIWTIVLGGYFQSLDLLVGNIFHFSVVKAEGFEWGSIGGIFLVSFLAAWINVHLLVHKERIFLLAFSAILLVTGSLVLGLYHHFINPLPFIGALLLGYVFSMMFLKTAVGARYPQFRSLFEGRLSRSHLRKLVNGETEGGFLGDAQEASFLVCSLNNSRELMEALDPQDYVAITNLYLQVASDFLVEIGGYLEECSGESLRVIFGAPLPVKGGINHGAKAVRAAYDLMLRLDELNYQCDERWQQRLDVRMGVHSGKMIVGRFGGARLNHYSAAGPVVEFTSYLSAACRYYGCRILVGPKTYTLAEAGIEFRPIDLLQRKGLRRRVELYEALAPKQMLSAERERSRNFFWRGVIFFREQEWEKAVEAFTEARIMGIPDKVLDLYFERIDRARRGDRALVPEQVILAEALYE